MATERQTFLSGDVHELVVSACPGALYIHGRFLAVDLSLKWKELELLFKAADEDMTDPKLGVPYIKEVAAEMAAVLSMDVHEYMMKSRFIDLIQWTGHSFEILESFSCLRSSRPCSALFSILLSSSFLERALGDLYICVSGDTKCPSLFKDLIAKHELRRVLGPAAIYLLSCLMGPPTTLNLRNISWHGFFHPEEVHPQYAMLLLTVIVSIGSLVEGMQYASQLSHRPQVQFSQLSVLKHVPYSEVEMCTELLSGTSFVIQSKKLIWEEAFHLWKEQNYGLFTVVILPEVEHGLRRIFAHVNNCPHRVLTAESSALFTTFDEILSPCLGDGTVNKLPAELGIPLMEMLQDLLAHPNGLRLRDRVSHGEVDLASCPAEVAQFVMEVTIQLCTKYHSQPLHRDTTPRKYKSLFHPSSLLQQSILSVLKELSKWEGIPTPEDFLMSVDNSALKYKESCEEVATGMGFKSDIDKFLTEGDGFVCTVWKREVETLFTPRHHLEVVGVLRQIIVACSQAVDQIFTIANKRYGQFRSKTLRSRQRSNYQRLLLRISLYKYSVLLCVLTVMWLMKDLKDFSPAIVQQIIRYVKKLLSCCENAVSQTAKCRWDETETLCSSMKELIDKLIMNSA